MTLPHLPEAGLQAPAGYSVNQVLTLANRVIGGETSALSSGLSLSELNGIVTSINENYDNGTVDQGFLR
jgi:hypothetical protein